MNPKPIKILAYTFLFVLSISVTHPVFAGQPGGSAYLDGGTSKSALILAHGKGKHPTWKVVDPLRKGVHKKLGFHTLSLQMPNDKKDWKNYVDDFPDAYEQFKDAIRFLKEERNVSIIYLMGHSMGSRMASAFVFEHPDQPIAGLIVAGCRNNGGYPLSCDENLRNVKIPVLDIWGGNNRKDDNAASERKVFVSKTYKQIEIPGANHRFEGYEGEFVTAVVEWLKTRQ